MKIISTVYVLAAILSLCMPESIDLFLGIGVALSCAAYVLYVYIPLFFSKCSMWLGAGMFFLPVPILIAAAVLLEAKVMLFWLLFALTLGVGCVLPLVRFLCFRRRMYALFAGDACTFRSFLQEGRKTPLCVSRDTTEGKITLALLGDIGAVRYFPEQDTVTVQSVRALSAAFLHELERKEDTALHRTLLAPLMGRKQSLPYTAPDADTAAYLAVHPQCIVYNGAEPAEYGDRVGGYTLISPKTLESMLRRTQIKE